MTSKRSPSMFRTIAPILASPFLVTHVFAENVLRVGSTQLYTDIGQALAAAQPGDLILVDPGSYPPFAIDGLQLSDVSVVADSAPFSINQTAGVAEIEIQNIPAGSSVSIIGAHIPYVDQLAPAVYVHSNLGAVRFVDLDVEPISDLLATTARACVEVVDTDTFWLTDSSIWSVVQPFGYTASPLVAGGITNDGFSGLLMEDSQGIVQNSRLSGYHNEGSLGGPTGYGGDGLRAIGEDTSVWLLEDHEGPAYQTRFRGGSGVIGGHAVHQVRSVFAPNQITSCGGPDNAIGLTYQPGQQFGGCTGNFAGGYIGFNNSNNIVFVSCLHWTAKAVKHCPSDDRRNETTVTSPLVAIGTNLQVKVRTRLDRTYSMYFSFVTNFTFSVPGFTGRGMVGSPFATLSGNTTAQTVTTLNLPIPPLAALIGSQVSVQGAFGPPGGPVDNLGLPAMVVVGP